MEPLRITRRSFMKSLALTAAGAVAAGRLRAAEHERPNIVVIYADDLGYGDVSCYGATEVNTPNIDSLAAEGLRFTNAHSASATCTPSRYAMLTGQYAWRKKGTGVAPGNAAMIIKPGTATVASILKDVGYTTGVVGKWHLGLGSGKIDWNGQIKPGPRELGFDYNFLIPATGDRVPCVFVENRRVVNLDPSDPITVSYGKPIDDEPTGRTHPELLKMHPSHGHDQTIVNGISRIGYMSGGKSALWKDEDIADRLTGKAIDFIETNKDKTFFLYFATHDIHVPRVPNPRFVGKTAMGPRGDAIVQLDWCTGQIIETLERLGLTRNTLVIFTSDNGPVVDDGYKDQSVELLDGHKPDGPLRGGKYSAFDAGTRVPFIVRWPGHVKPGQSSALACQIDLSASLATLTGGKLGDNDAPDSFDILPALLGRTQKGRDNLVEAAGTLSIIKGSWKYIAPSKGPRINRAVNIELGNNPKPQLYDLDNDIGEHHNVAAEHPEKTKELAELLAKIKGESRSRP